MTDELKQKWVIASSKPGLEDMYGWQIETDGPTSWDVVIANSLNYKTAIHIVKLHNAMCALITEESRGRK
jgi:hypothetical protein